MIYDCVGFPYTSVQDAAHLHPANDPCSVELYPSPGVRLDVLVRVAELGYQNVEKNYDTRQEVERHQD